MLTVYLPQERVMVSISIISVLATVSLNMVIR